MLISFSILFFTDTNTSLSLWAGTSLGSVIVISITLPDNIDNRVLQLQEVSATPSGKRYDVLHSKHYTDSFIVINPH